MGVVTPSMTLECHFRKARHACGMNEKGYILVNLGQFEDEAPLTACKYKDFGVREYQQTF